MTPPSTVRPPGAYRSRHSGPNSSGGPRGWPITPDTLLLTIGLGALVLWPMVVALRGPQPLQLPVLLAHLCGMLAGYGIVVLLALMSRAPALERGRRQGLLRIQEPAHRGDQPLQRHPVRPDSLTVDATPDSLELAACGVGRTVEGVVYGQGSVLVGEDFNPPRSGPSGGAQRRDHPGKVERSLAAVAAAVDGVLEQRPDDL